MAYTIDDINKILSYTSWKDKKKIDKAVLETCAAGIINFYRSEDFDFLYSENLQNILKFDKNNLFEKIDDLDSFNKDEILRNIETAQKQSKNHSTNNIVKNLIDIFNR